MNVNKNNQNNCKIWIDDNDIKRKRQKTKGLYLENDKDGVKNENNQKKVCE